MRFRFVILAAITVLIGSGWALAQSTSTSDARGQGEALATDIRDATTDSILSAGSEAQVPGFGGTEFSESRYVDDPDGLTAAGEAQRHDDSYRTIVDPHRPVFDPTTIDLASAESVAQDPDAFLGTSLGLAGDTGSCESLPDSGTTSTTYFESCNQGDALYEEARSCPVFQRVDIDAIHQYTCETVDIYIPEHRICVQPSRIGCKAYATVAEAIVESVSSCSAALGSCTLIADTVSEEGFQYIAAEKGAHDDSASGANRSSRYARRKTRRFECISEHTPAPSSSSALEYYLDWRRAPKTAYYWPDGPAYNWIAAETYDGLVAGGVTSFLDESACITATEDAECTLQSEICTDDTPQTRMIGGVSVTHPCWMWERTYQCRSVAPANDCGELEARSECSFSHDECLSYRSDGTTCNVYDRWYQCTTPDEGSTRAPEYICAGDLYCIDGECTSVERQASTEFKDAMVAIQAMGELRDDFDEDTLRLFTGENLKCKKKLFGLANCCSGKGVPLLTPLLCSAEDRLVDEKDDAGLCHYVGTYCSSKVLGVCTTKKQSYCCFSSKLTRILQEQGRAQLGMGWGKTKSPDCEGFLVEEFQRLDLSRMDFSEVYGEFTEAARLPDEIETSLLIQERIADYYELHSGD